MDDIDLPIPPVQARRTGRSLHADKRGVIAEWYDMGRQHTRHANWIDIEGKTLMVLGKPITVSQLKTGMAVLEAALEQLANGSGPLAEVTP